MSEGEVAKTHRAETPETKPEASVDAGKDQARSRLSLDAGLSDPKKGPDTTEKTVAQRAQREPTSGELVFEPIAGYDHKYNDGTSDRTRLAANRSDQPTAAGQTELAHGDRSKIVRDKDGAISDQGDINGQHYDITASKDKDSIVWKDGKGKEHRFERKKGENSNEYVDGDGTKLVQHGDHNTVTFKEGFQVDIDARTGRSIIKHDDREIAQYNGKDAVKRQLDDNNVAFQVRGDVNSTVDQIKDYQKRTGQPQNGNMIIKNEKGDTVVMQQDGTEISRKADSATVTIKRGDTSIEYTPGQPPKILSGGQHVTNTDGGLQIDGKEMLTDDGAVSISGMKDGKLDSRHGRIYGTTDKGGQIDLGTGRAIADSLTTTNTGTGVEATTSNGTTILKTGPDGKKIESGPVTTNVDADKPTTTIRGSDGSNININNNDGSSQMTDSSGAEIANIKGNGDVCTWDGTFLGAGGDIFNSDMDFSGFTNYASDGYRDFSSSSSGSGSGSSDYEQRNDVSAAVASNSSSAAGMADAVYSNATSLANNLNANPGTLGQIDASVGTLAACAAQLEALLPLNPNLADELALVNQSWAKLDGIRSVVQNEVAVQEMLRTRHGITDKSTVANVLQQGGAVAVS